MHRSLSIARRACAAPERRHAQASFASVLAPALLACGVIAAVAPTAHAALPSYSLVGSYALPDGSFDLLPDGRLVAVDSTGAIRVQDAPNANTYSPLGSIDGTIFDGPFGNFGAIFLRVSPDGSHLAIGDNAAHDKVHFVDASALSTSSVTPTTAVSSSNYDAVWTDNHTLFVTGSDSLFNPVVTRIDTNTNTSTIVMTAGSGGSGGITTDGTHLFVADGYNPSSGGAPTGNVRSFNLSDLAAPLPTSPIDFTTGLLVADALTGASLGFDAQGNFLVGGGDYFAGSNDAGYAAVIDKEAIAVALLGGPFAQDSDELRLSPASSPPFLSYHIFFNAATNELIVGADGTAYRYALVPTPTTAALFTVGIAAAGRRRRHA